MRVTVKFTVIRRSENTNSFGLRQFMVMDRDGETYHIHGNYLHDLKVKDKVSGKIPFAEAIIESDGRRLVDHVRQGNAQFDGYELVERLDNCPEDVLSEIIKEYF